METENLKCKCINSLISEASHGDGHKEREAEWNYRADLIKKGSKKEKQHI